MDFFFEYFPIDIQIIAKRAPVRLLFCGSYFSMYARLLFLSLLGKEGAGCAIYGIELQTSFDNCSCSILRYRGSHMSLFFTIQSNLC